jgi:hypothetical protein
MGEKLDYARPAPREPYRLLAAYAHITLAWPILGFGLLYCQWLLAWCMLGHIPQPSLDDPTSIVVANGLHPLTLIAWFGAIPAFFAGVALKMIHVALRQLGWGWGSLRLLAFAAIWIGAYELIQLDPGSVIYWWAD